MLGIIQLTPNVALRGTATQSADYVQSNYHASPFVAGHANDGNLETSMAPSRDACSLTKDTPPVWWQVDLLKVYVITKIAITGREEFCKSSFVFILNLFSSLMFLSLIPAFKAL